MEKPLNFPFLLETMQKLLAEGPTDRLARIAGHAPHTLHLQSRAKLPLAKI